MSDEKPTCGYELCFGPHKYMTIPGRLTQYADCPGPVIATEPETPVDESVRSQVSNEYALPPKPSASEATVTDADTEWYVKFFTENHLEWPYWARVKAALEAFVARKLKGEPK